VYVWVLPCVIQSVSDAESHQPFDCVLWHAAACFAVRVYVLWRMCGSS